MKDPDIVDRLRRAGCNAGCHDECACAVAKDAATEIKRLRKELVDFRQHVQLHYAKV